MVIVQGATENIAPSFAVSDICASGSIAARPLGAQAQMAERVVSEADDLAAELADEGASILS